MPTGFGADIIVRSKIHRCEITLVKRSVMPSLADDVRRRECSSGFTEIMSMLAYPGS